MTTTIVYPGSFDPITNGHIDLATRGARLFDRLLFAVAGSGKKVELFTMEERIELAREALKPIKNVEVHGCNELVVKFAKRHKVNVILRGARSSTDFNYEQQLAGMNHSMSPNLETLFMAPSLELAAISSSLIREIANLGGNVSRFVPANVNKALKEKYG